MTEFEHRMHYAAQQREAHANDAAGWYGQAKVAEARIAELEGLLTQAMEAKDEFTQKLRDRVKALEAQIESLLATPFLPGLEPSQQPTIVDLPRSPS